MRNGLQPVIRNAKNTCVIFYRFAVVLGITRYLLFADPFSELILLFRGSSTDECILLAGY